MHTLAQIVPADLPNQRKPPRGAREGSTFLPKLQRKGARGVRVVQRDPAGNDLEIGLCLRRQLDLHAAFRPVEAFLRTISSIWASSRSNASSSGTVLPASISSMPF